MAKSSIGELTDVTTQSEAPRHAENGKLGSSAPQRETTTVAYYIVGSVPSGLPEILEAENRGYVFRVGGSPQSGTVTITLDADQLAEQARIREINRAIGEASRR